MGFPLEQLYFAIHVILKINNFCEIHEILIDLKFVCHIYKGLYKIINLNVCETFLDAKLRGFTVIVMNRFEEFTRTELKKSQYTCVLRVGNFQYQ